MEKITKKDRFMKTKVRKRNIEIKIRSLNLDLNYSEVKELIKLIPRFSDLKKLRKDLIKWLKKLKK